MYFGPLHNVLHQQVIIIAQVSYVTKQSTVKAIWLYQSIGVKSAAVRLKLK